MVKWEKDNVGQDNVLEYYFVTFFTKIESMIKRRSENEKGPKTALLFFVSDIQQIICDQ